jgi:hypothetical protein
MAASSISVRWCAGPVSSLSAVPRWMAWLPVLSHTLPAVPTSARVKSNRRCAMHLRALPVALTCAVRPIASNSQPPLVFLAQRGIASLKPSVKPKRQMDDATARALTTRCQCSRGALGAVALSSPGAAAARQHAGLTEPSGI